MIKLLLLIVAFVSLYIGLGKLFKKFILEVVYVESNKRATLAWMFFPVSYRANQFGTDYFSVLNPTKWTIFSLLRGYEVEHDPPVIYRRKYNDWDNQVAVFWLPWALYGIVAGVTWIAWRYGVRPSISLVWTLFKMFILWDDKVWSSLKSKFFSAKETKVEKTKLFRTADQVNQDNATAALAELEAARAKAKNCLRKSWNSYS